MADVRRTMRVQGAIAIALLLGLSVCVSKASAEPLSMTFTEARANVGVQLSDAALLEAPATAPLTAQIIPGTGAITDGVMTVPQFATHITAPIDDDVTVDFDIGVIEGTFNQPTGALTLQGEAGGTLRAEDEDEECVVATVPAILSLSTAGNSGGTTNPRSGAPFSAGLTGPGAIAGTWTDMTAEPVDPLDPDNVSFCKNVYAQIGGPGGIWLQQQGDLVPPPAPQLTGTDPGSPNASGTPRIRGAAEAGSTVRLFAGAGCTGAPVASGSAAQLASPGLAVTVAEGATASFSANATDAVGNSSVCSASISYTRSKASSPAPPPPPPPVVGCEVPKLAGKAPARARAVLREAGCKVGKVQRPKRPKGKKGPWVLVVKSSSPAAGERTTARVHLKLGPKS